MPISNGKYVAPTWINNNAPAIDADELQAMSDTIEANQNSRAISIIEDGIVTDSFSVHRLINSVYATTAASTANVNGIAYGGGAICAVAGSYGIIYNKNGFDWYTKRDSSMITGTMNDIKYANGMFVAVGESIISFEDPAGTWTTRTKPTTSGTIYAIDYISNKWVVGTTNGIFYSTTLNSWTKVVASICRDLDLWNNDSYLLAATEAGAYRSADGVTWTKIDGSVSGLRKVGASKNSSYAVFTGGSDSETFALLYNASTSTWSTYDTPSENYCRIVDCVYYNGSAYVVEVWTSADEGVLNQAKVIKNPFDSDGGTYVNFYGASITNITCAEIVNGDIYFGGLYGGIITNIKSGSVVNASGDAIAPRFYGQNLLVDFPVDVKFATDSSEYFTGIRTTYLSGKMTFELKGVLTTSSYTNSWVWEELPLPSALTVDQDKGVWVINATSNAARGKRSHASDLDIVCNYVGNNKLVVVLSTGDDTALNQYTLIHYSVAITFIPADISNPSIEEKFQ